MAAFKDRTGRADDKEAADAMLATAVVDGGCSDDETATGGRGRRGDRECGGGGGGGAQCGIGPCRSKWMQVFASKQVFLATFCFSWVLQGMFSTYFVSVITTLEKLFQLQSKTMGIVLSATEIGQIGSSLLLTYYGGQGHRPRWIASSMVLFGVAALACSSPHFLFGHHPLTVSSSSSSSSLSNATADDFYPPNMCVTPEHAAAAAAAAGAGQSSPALPPRDTCEKNTLSEQQEQSKNTQIVLAIFFTSLLGVGIGQTAVYTLGIPFIDDNVASRESPLYFSITIGVRILGPSFGFLLGAFCTSLYADLSTVPNMNPDHPRWVGAWWLGLVGISATLLLASVPMFAFPKRLPSSALPPPPGAVAAASEKQQIANGLTGATDAPPPAYGNGVVSVVAAPPKAPRLKDFPTAVKRLLKNDMLMYRTASSVFHLLPLAGIYTFLPKYFESQFHFPTHTANMVTGTYSKQHDVFRSN